MREGGLWKSAGHTWMNQLRMTRSLNSSYRWALAAIAMARSPWSAYSVTMCNMPFCTKLGPSSRMMFGLVVVLTGRYYTQTFSSFLLIGCACWHKLRERCQDVRLFHDVGALRFGQALELRHKSTNNGRDFKSKGQRGGPNRNLLDDAELVVA